MKRTRSLQGVEWYETKAGEAVVYIRYQCNGRQHRECIGPVERDQYGRDQTHAQAKRILRDRRREIDQAKTEGREWLPPRARRKAEVVKAKAAAIAASVDRAPLLFEAAVERFKTHGLDRYAKPENAKSALRMLARAFRGRFLDELAQRDVRDFQLHRLAGTGPFADWPRRVGPRVPQMETAWLSALYNYLVEEEGRETLTNPCIGFRGGRRKGKGYKPAHDAIVPTDEERAAIFDAAHNPKHRAMVVLAYYTMARPESELGRLRHRDVVLSTDERATFVGMGWVEFHRTKTDRPRTVPLHPEAEAAVAAIMLPRPTKLLGESDVAYQGRLEEWGNATVFRRRDGAPWRGRASYADAWADVLGRAAERFPRLRGMWLRDFRKAGITDGRARGMDSAIMAKLAGHSPAMSDHYTQAPTELAIEAIRRLGASPATAGGRTSGRTSARAVGEKR